MQSNIKILYLYAEIMSYTEATLKELENKNVELHIVHWDKQKITPYKISNTFKSKFYKRSNYDASNIRNLIKSISPNLIVVSGWMDKGYLNAIHNINKADIPIVCAIDGQWNNTPKQILAKILGKLGYFKKYFSHAWVAGNYQYEFARNIGFEKKNIIYDLYSADVDKFHKVYQENLAEKYKSYPHKFLFLGRFEKTKNILLLLDAWKLCEPYRKDWELILIGNGSLKKNIENNKDIIIKDFKQSDELLEEFKKYGCAILPSRSEPWGVVLHEFAASGLPIICSNVCGAKTTFLIHGYNGYEFEYNSASSLSLQMKKIINLSNSNLQNMSYKSLNLSKRISPTTSAANLLSIVLKNDEKK